jgi:hypothetical protein
VKVVVKVSFVGVDVGSVTGIAFIGQPCDPLGTCYAEPERVLCLLIGVTQIAEEPNEIVYWFCLKNLL